MTRKISPDSKQTCFLRIRRYLRGVRQKSFMLLKIADYYSESTPQETFVAADIKSLLKHATPTDKVR